jgi:hypothetical protein
MFTARRGIEESGVGRKEEAGGGGGEEEEE